MQADATVRTYLELLGISNYVPDAPTTYLKETHLQELWCAFQAFARIPLECHSQHFCFEYYFGGVEQEQLSIAFRRNFYVPIEDNPENLIPLGFEVAADYLIPRPMDYARIFFVTEVETDLDEAVQKYCNEVESHRLSWGP
ncbi:MAG: hypothetical protein JXB30_09675 [Anaerolineae bacterium]|nr:hypothetical protein [Anaerolineae bacterium]